MHGECYLLEAFKLPVELIKKPREERKLKVSIFLLVFYFFEVLFLASDAADKNDRLLS
jgi:hypothetical protein